MIGRTISHYRILGKLGEGGMGVVYHAIDTRLERHVAVKFLRPEAVADPERKGRFIREARAASALNHPNIVTIYDIGSAEGLDFIAMEQVDGESLDRRIPPRGLPVSEALRFAAEATDALAAAHAAGIVHRDVKPANLMITTSGRIKVLDFGLAKLLEPSPADKSPADSRLATATGAPPATAATKYTREGTVLGTLAYMSPEQVEGRPADARTDVFALGVVLYEMLASRRPFQGASTIGIMTAILRDVPPPLRSLRSGVPPGVERIVRRCLEKNPDSRYPSARQLAQDLATARTELEGPSLRLGAVLRQPRYAIPAVLLLLAVLGGAAWLWTRGTKERWARNEALPEIARLVEKDSIGPAFLLAREAARYIPEDRELQRLWSNVSITATIATNPSGADVSFKQYTAVDAAWQPIGRSPVEKIRLPNGYVRFRIEKEGYEPFEGVPEPELTGNDAITFRIVLSPKGSSPPGMIPIGAGRYAPRDGTPVEVPAFWLDKHEVTNAAFKAFVDGGGYRNPAYWKHPFVKGGENLAFEKAMVEFRDGTGRAGPATWELGTYPEGRADFPVGGVSWHEAAGYAEFVQKSLPTLYHWLRAAEFGVFSDILQLSNFGGEGPVRVGSLGGVGPFGTYDMAGNVKEWCWNESGGQRYVLGGAWNEPSYVYDTPAIERPFARLPTYGFRCAKYGGPVAENLTAPVEIRYRDYSRDKPVSDETYRLFESLYSYDRGELRPIVEAVDDTTPHWRREKITFNAAYGGERVIAWLYLPRNASPPYQTVLYFPDSTAELFRSSENAPTRSFDFIVRSGRALLLPVYKGTYERRSDSARPGASARRDLLIQWAKDLGRSIDYLETRKDIDASRLAFYGFSLGAAYAPVLTAVEKRFRASIVLGGGFTGRPLPPEAEAINFAPRVRVPTLMVSGREDFIRPVEISQRPLFNMLGTAEKKLAVIEGGHVPPKIQSLIKEILDWLDRYLAPVTTKG